MDIGSHSPRFLRWLYALFAACVLQLPHPVRRIRVESPQASRPSSLPFTCPTCRRVNLSPSCLPQRTIAFSFRSGGGARPLDARVAAVRGDTGRSRRSRLQHLRAASMTSAPAL